MLLSVLVGANLGGAFGSTLGALAGAVVAIPVGGAIQVIFSEMWNQTRAAAPGPGDPAATAVGLPRARLTRTARDRSPKLPA